MPGSQGTCDQAFHHGTSLLGKHSFCSSCHALPNNFSRSLLGRIVWHDKPKECVCRRLSCHYLDFILLFVALSSTPQPYPESTQLISFTHTYPPSSHDSYLIVFIWNLFHVRSPVSCNYIILLCLTLSNLVTFTERLPKSAGGRRRSMSSVLKTESLSLRTKIRLS